MPKTGDKRYTQSSWSRDYDRERALKKRRKRSEEQVAAKYAEEIDCPYLDLNIFPIDQVNLNFIPKEKAKEYEIVLLKKVGREVKVGAVDPKREDLQEYINKLEEKNGVKVKLHVVSKSAMKQAWENYNFTSLKDRIDNLAVSVSEEELEGFKGELESLMKLEKRITEVPTTEVLNVIIAGAIKLDASDIHFEPQRKQNIRLRYRIDGVLQTVANFTANVYPNIISRVKLLGDMVLNVNDISQDGRFSVKVSEEDNIDCRVSILPGSYGESIVLRLLNQDISNLKMENLGLRGLAYERLAGQTSKTEGVIVNSGPTGSGKTTTLYSIINKLNEAEKKIITIEDPVEYRMPGIVQTQVSDRHGYTFAKGLRAIVRQDPDILLVGEIRDDETASIAMQSAMTGHLVLTTIHSNSSAAVVSRMMDLGLDSNEIASTVNALIAQRLVRRLCPHCKENYEPAQNTIETLKKMLSVISPKANVEVPKNINHFYKAKGCPKCKGIGYKGRVGIFEILTFSEKIKEKIIHMASETEITRQSLEEGMITMVQDGILKALEGETSLKEIQRVTGKGDYLVDLYEKIMLRSLSRGVDIEKEEYEKTAGELEGKKSFQKMLENTPVKKMIKQILLGGMLMRAGDVHIEPGEDTFKIRYRIDGVLQDVAELPLDDYLSLLNQVKSLSGFETSKREGGTMDGRFGINMDEKLDQVENKKIAVRVSIILGGYGDIVVMRILDKSAKALDIEKIGFSGPNLRMLKEEIARPNGIIINTGPTGSGKTTTLYSILSKLNEPEVKIITVEDPIEYQMEGVIQTQVNKEEDYTFAKAMRSLLRQNPDIMMVGEIRDEETAQIAYRAALTGHLVVSTLHTNNAAGSVQRLVDMGVGVSDISSGTNCFIAQRLVRKLCPRCKKKREINKEEKKTIEEALHSMSDKLKVDEKKEIPEFVFEATGCAECGNIGYKGRLPVAEMLQVDEEMEKYLTEKPTTSEIENKAIEKGMITMYQDGILRVIRGETTLEEVYRVAGEQ